ncbi:membrane protein [Bacteroidia bacterium]|nr:membrane protein [Bacteroidia bacterium]
MATAVLMSSSILFSSCIGSFTLFHKVLSWNQSVGDKWINELVFLALCVVPVYEIAWLIDGVVLNSIEFWTGENPASADAQVKQVETANGLVTITTDANGHKIQKEGSDEIVEFNFNKEENSWSLNAMGTTTPLVQFTADNQAKVYLADGSTMTVSTDQAGVLALKQVIGNAYFANK